MTRYTPLWEQAGSYSAVNDRRLIGALWPTPASSGCAVTVSGGMTVNVAAGTVAVPSQNQTGSTLCYSDAVEQVTLAAAPGSGSNRYDLVVCQPRSADLDGGANNDFVFAAVTGVAAASPTVPAVPAGQVALAQIYVPGGSAAIVAGNIVDVRPHGLGPEVPLSAGAALAFYTDPQGEAWVAKGGVNGGAWKKARDVLRARLYRGAAFTTIAGGGGQAFPFDTVDYDSYGLGAVGAAAGFTVPVAGIYRLVVAIHLTGATTAGRNYLFATISAPALQVLVADQNAAVNAPNMMAGSQDVLVNANSVISTSYVTAIAQPVGSQRGETFTTCQFVAPA
jgi:hypothetical protein